MSKEIICWLKDPKWKQCCCACQYQLPLYSHPCVDGKSVTHKMGYICLYPEYDRKAILTNKHGLCECYEKRGKKKKYNISLHKGGYNANV